MEAPGSRDPEAELVAEEPWAAGEEAWRPLLYRVVKISGLDGAAVAEAPAAGDLEGGAPGIVQVDGKLGRTVAFDEEEGKYVVQTLEEGFLVALPEENLVEHELQGPEDGGFDQVWPYDDEGLFSLGWEVTNCLATRGWCLLQVPRRDASRTEAAAKAQRLPFATHKRELLPDFLGHTGVGKATEIDPLSLSDVETVSSRLSFGLPDDPIERYDGDLCALFAALAPVTWDTMGFNCAGRTDSMVWLPYANPRERNAMEPTDLDNDDIEEGVVERHLRFLRRRKLCFLYMVESEGGRLRLYSRAALETERPVELPVVKGRLLVFRCDRLTYWYEPLGEHVTLVNWVLDEPPRMKLSDIEGEPKARDELAGILRGPGAPYHEAARILGLACWTGGSVFNPHSAIAMYTAGTDGGVRCPFTRFDTDVYFTKNGQDDHLAGANSYHVHGGLCGDEVVMGFDNNFFGISNDEAVIMCPNQRKVLEVGYEALVSAGHNKESLKNAPIMVYMGDCGTEWTIQLMGFRLAGVSFDGTRVPFEGDKTKFDWNSAGSLTTIGSRLSYQLGLRGPVFHCDTACSSGLTAFCTSMYSLRTSPTTGSLDPHVSGALSGGVNQIMDPGIYIGNSAQHMLSLKGRCFTFDSGGDGYGRGEGTSVAYTVFSKDQKHMEMQEGVAVGNKVNQDGRSASMTAPNGPSQQLCIKSSLREAQLDPHDITASECHGTGTALGDPIEVGSLRGVQETDNRDNALLCTSSKSNIGHLEADAGVTGLFKCILMGKWGLAPPNVHLRTLNPHLDVNGWPAVFENDPVDLSQNSALTGVSSFGVSGTNAHAEVWAQCRTGPNSTARQASFDPQKLDQIKVTCPVTMGPIDYLTGEPIWATPRTGRNGEKLMPRADVLRDELAPYDVSSYAYEGAYRFRREELPDAGEELERGSTVAVCGSWSGWKRLEDMELQADGSYRRVFVLGETCCEAFFLCLNRDPAQRMYPAISTASEKIWIEGPDDQGRGRRWIIDGRDEHVHAGTLYAIHFWWGLDRKRISWEEVSPKDSVLALRYEHSYAVVGTWTSWTPHELTRNPDEAGVWECTLRMGPSGEEEFQFVRDSDPQQSIYPARPRTSSLDVAVRGPDQLGKGKHWLIQGRMDEFYTIRLEVDDGGITVTTSHASGVRVWKSKDGWDRHDYCVAGSWSNWICEMLNMDPQLPGFFKYRGQVGTDFSEEHQGFVEFFQVVVDEDMGQALYPELPDTGPGECIVHGPDGESQGRMWMARSLRPGAFFEIVLNLKAEDRRQIVTWTWEDPLALTLGADGGLPPSAW